MLQKGQAMEHLATCGKAGEGLKQMSRVGWEAGKEEHRAGRGVKGGNQQGFTGP